MTKLRFTAALIVLLLCVNVLAGCGNKPAASQGRQSVTIERVVDGDTVEITQAGKKEKVRLIGIDTPETKKPNKPVMFYGKEAYEYTKKRLEKKTVQLEWDVEERDQYKRLLAYVWIGDELFNRTLVQEGYARIYTFPPNVKYAAELKKDQETARKKGKGLWEDYDSAFDKKSDKSED